MKKIKNFVATIALSTILFAGISTNASALVGMALPAAKLGTAVAFLISGGTSLTIAGTEKGLSSKETWNLLIFGLICLDKESNSIEFKQLSDSTAQKLNISTEERTAYNEELESINLAAQDAIAADSSEVFKSSISELAFNTIVKMSK